MGFKSQLSEATGIAADKLPSSYQIVGTVLLMKLSKLTTAQKNKIGKAMLEMLPNVKTVCEVKEVAGEFREPIVSVLAGNGTATLHKENDIIYKIDAAKIMFSKGNLTERKRLIEQVKPGEEIVDMFAGIGYFSLGLAKFTKARRIMAIEKNPVAYRFLTDNIEINKVPQIHAVNDDCKLAAAGLREHADRIIMGYFPGTEKFLPYAIYMAKEGGIIHYHNIYKIHELWAKPLAEIKEACDHYRIGYEVLAKKKVKSYAPYVQHVVVDFRISRASS
jgi:tRNA wybutosine-synthesizing protein 2